MDLHIAVRLEKYPENASHREKSLLETLAVRQTRIELLEAHLQKYEDARERGVVPTLVEIAIDNEVLGAKERAAQFISRAYPGYAVSIHLSTFPTPASDRA